MPNTPKDGESNHDSSASNDERSDPPEDSAELDQMAEDTLDILDPDWLTPKHDIPPVEMRRGTWWTKRYKRKFKKRLQELQQKEKDAARAREQEEALDNTLWHTDTPSKATLPDGTQVEVSGGDFEDADTGQLRPGRSTWRQALMIGGALGALGVLAALMLMFNGGETETLETKPAATQETTAGEADEESTEPLSAVDPTESATGFVASFINCTPPTQQDATGWFASPRPGEEAKEVAEIAAVTATDRAFNLQCSGFGFGSYVFTMIVEGDAEAVSKTEGTTFDLRFVVNNTWPQNVYEDDSGFTVFIGWNTPAQVYFGSVSNSDRAPVQDATVNIVWLDPSTLEATVTLPGDDIDVRNVRTELIGLTQDAQEITTAQYFDVAIWTATP